MNIADVSTAIGLTILTVVFFRSALHAVNTRDVTASFVGGFLVAVFGILALFSWMAL